jgi:hypothetical protein
MNVVRYTLLADGASDQRLMPIIDWVMRDIGVEKPLLPQWADRSRFPRKVKGLEERVRLAVSAYPCDVLFVHRDAEKVSYEDRLSEVVSAIQNSEVVSIPVIPVRMTEAWLLFDEMAIRRASGNPNGRIDINLPDKKKFEELTDPKDTLHGLLRLSSGLSGRRLRQLNESSCAALVAGYIDDFSPLKGVTSFDRFRESVLTVAQSMGW